MKYRIWNKIDCVFETECFYVDSNGRIRLLQYQGGNSYSVYDDLDQSYLIISQFTGAFDVDKREIYVGDILKCIYRTLDKYVLVTETKSPIGFTIEYQHIGNFLSYNEVKIVGNIYQNPELLNKNEK